MFLNKNDEKNHDIFIRGQEDQKIFLKPFFNIKILKRKNLFNTLSLSESIHVRVAEQH